jgi:oligopeptidase A
MENWCYHKTTLMSFAKHYKTGETLPDDLYDKLVAAKNYRSGTMMLRQLHFSVTDLDLHATFTPGQGESIYDREKKIAEKTTVMPPLDFDRFLCGFSHIFAGGYAAGYFSYKWAEVLSADAFSAFEEVGLDDDAAVAEVGKRFKDTVLGLGGGRSPEKVFRDFRGRDPSTEPLLRHSDLLAAKE